jgi:hypothetical protein
VAVSRATNEVVGFSSGAQTRSEPEPVPTALVDFDESGWWLLREQKCRENEKSNEGDASQHRILG